MFDPHHSSSSSRGFGGGGMGMGSSASVLAPRPPAAAASSSLSHVTSSSTSRSRSVARFADVPQSSALQMMASRFRTDPKLHLRNLLADASRCQGLMAVHRTSRSRESGSSSSSSSSSGGGTTTTTGGGGGTMTRQSSGTSTDNNNNNGGGGSGGRRIIFDYSRQHVTGETMEVLFDLADRMGLTEIMNDMRNGTTTTTSRGGGGGGGSATTTTTTTATPTHHVLRMPRDYYDASSSSSKGGVVRGGGGRDAMMSGVHGALDRVERLSDGVRDGSILGCTGSKLMNVVCIGVGGGHACVEFVSEALRGDANARAAAAASSSSSSSSSSGGRTTLRFVEDVDPVNFDLEVRDLDPRETMFVITSGKFDAGSDEIRIARAARRWLVSALCGNESTTTTDVDDGGDDDDEDVPSREDEGEDDEDEDNDGRISEENALSYHFCAVTSSPDEARRFGIAHDRIFPLWDWAGGRFSVWSASGVLPLSVHYSYDVVRRMLDGAHDIDEHFFDAPLGGNIPVLLGLIGIWNSTFMGYHARCILPYSRALRTFPSVVQKFDMESNGKGVTASGVNLNFHAGEVDFGDSGSVGMHSFCQLLHQGRPVPADFVGFMESQSPHDEVDCDSQAGTGTDNTDGWDAESGVSGHDELMSNFFAQPDALAIGKTLNDLIQEGVEDYLRPHKVFPGNRPSSSILMTRLDAFALGQLLAIYEHRTAVQGFVWGINPFDSFGAELGMANAARVRAQLSASRRRGASVQGFNSSTGFLLEAYLSHGRASR